MTAAALNPVATALIAKGRDRTALCGIVGLGYVGLPLVIEFVRAGYRVLGFDVNKGVVEGLNAGRSHIQDVPSADVERAVKEGRFEATTDLRYVWTGELDVRGSNGWRRDDLAALIELVRAKRLRPVIDQVLPLSRGIEAVRLLEERRFFGKIVVTP